jgi:hypothetical protein
LCRAAEHDELVAGRKPVEIGRSHVSAPKPQRHRPKRATVHIRSEAVDGHPHLHTVAQHRVDPCHARRLAVTPAIVTANHSRSPDVPRLRVIVIDDGWALRRYDVCDAVQ